MQPKLFFLCVVTCFGCTFLRGTVKDETLNVSSLPSASADCRLDGDLLSPEENLRSHVPTVPALFLDAQNMYSLAWFRAEEVESPEDEAESSQALSELGILWMARLRPKSKQGVTGKLRLSNEHVSPSGLGFVGTGGDWAFSYSDEKASYLVQKTTAGKDKAPPISLPGVSRLQLAYTGKSGGLWAIWVEGCGNDAILQLARVNKEGIDREGARQEPVPGYPCRDAALVVKNQGSTIAVAWSQEKEEKQRLFVLLGDGNKGSFGESISLSIGGRALRGQPSLAWQKDSLSIAWASDEELLGFAAISAAGVITKPPQGLVREKGVAQPMLISQKKNLALTWSSNSQVKFLRLSADGTPTTAPLAIGAGDLPQLVSGSNEKELGVAFWRSLGARQKSLYFGILRCK